MARTSGRTASPGKTVRPQELATIRVSLHSRSGKSWNSSFSEVPKLALMR